MLKILVRWMARFAWTKMPPVTFAEGLEPTTSATERSARNAMRVVVPVAPNLERTIYGYSRIRIDVGQVAALQLTKAHPSQSF